MLPYLKRLVGYISSCLFYIRPQLVSDRQPWYYEDTMGMRQVGGFVKKFEQITLTTIRVSLEFLFGARLVWTKNMSVRKIKICFLSFFFDISSLELYWTLLNFSGKKFYWLIWIIFEPGHQKMCLMRTTKAQVSLRILAVWSAPLLFTA